MKRIISLVLGLVAVAAIMIVLSFSVSSGIRLVGGTPKASLNAGNFYDDVVTHRGVRMIVQPKDIIATGRTAKDVPPLTGPTFVSVDEAIEQNFLHTNLYGLQLFDGEVYRFYPLEILAWHELVFDRIGDTSIVVSYAPLSDSFVVFENDAALDLGYSGYVFNNSALILDRASNTLFSPLLNKGVYGKESGRALNVYPSSVIQWEIFAESHPDGKVLSSETGFEFPYEVSPYGGYLASKALIFPNAHESNGARLAKDGLFGVHHDGGAKAFDFVTIVKESGGVKNDVFSGKAFVVWVDKYGALHTNERGDERFVRAQEDALMDEDGNRWTFDPLAQTLTFGEEVRAFVPSARMFWYVWASTFPNTEIYGVVRGQGLVDGPFVAQEAKDDDGIRIEVDEEALKATQSTVEVEATSVEE